MAIVDTSRRRFLKATGLALAPGLAWSRVIARPESSTHIHLEPTTGTAYLLGAPYPLTPVWCYNGRIPGPVIRVPQHSRLRIVVDNRLDQDTTVHWHGIRLPNGMDGVPGLTQAPIPPGGSFVYEFEVPDAGTFWYHPHFNSSEQVGRGLSGALIVEEVDPIAVDRELLWVLDDWRLDGADLVREDFGQMRDKSHSGRLGNTVTVNGRLTPELAVRSGERVRLRLINTANARAFALDFAPHRPIVVAIDGQPVTPHEPPDGLVVLGAAMRADLILDLMQSPGTEVVVTDRFYRKPYPLARLVYTHAPALRDRPRTSEVRDHDRHQTAVDRQSRRECCAAAAQQDCLCTPDPFTRSLVPGRRARW